MKLDRHINPDGRGKYALINLRTNKVEWGGDDQFFVLKYKDKFAVAALKAYAAAVRLEAEAVRMDAANTTQTGTQFIAEAEAGSLVEYACEIEHEARIAASWPNRRIPD